jgi:hypothetical protein
MTTAAAQDDPPPSALLAPLLEYLPDLVLKEVLLGPRDLASLAGAGRQFASAVAATALMQWAKRAKMAADGGLFAFAFTQLCLAEACSYAARGGNQEVLEWLHNTGCPWNAETACAAAGSGTWKCCSGCTTVDARGAL